MENKLEKGDSNKKTMVINAFGGPGAGKTTATWEIAALLKKEGYTAEYVPEYAKELVWEENYALLEGSINNQKVLLKEQEKRINRLIGKVDFVVTDSPLFLNLVYCNKNDLKHKKNVINKFNAYNNFNLLIKRGISFEKEGRIQNLEESIKKDKEIVTLLEENNIYYGKYKQNKQNLIADNIIKNYLYKEGENKMEKNTAKEDKYTFIRTNKAFIKEGLQSKKDPNKTYNKVTMPSNAVIDGKNVGGYAFYPLFINQDKFSDNVRNIPILKERTVQLNKDEKKIEVSADSIKEAFTNSYKDFKKEKKEEKESGYPWQGLQLDKYVKGNILAAVAEKQDTTITIEDLTENINDSFNSKDAMEARAFIHHYYYEAIDLGENENWDKISPFKVPSAYKALMINKKVMEELDDLGILKGVKEITLDRDTVSDIGNLINKGNTFTIQDKAVKGKKKEKHMDMEL